MSQDRHLTPPGPAAHAPRDTGLHIEVFICTHNRSALLRRALRSVNDCERPAGAQVSILVAANACTDDTLDVLSRYGDDAPAKGWLALRSVTVPALGKAQALNRALPLVQGTAVAFVDDDHRLAPGYLAAVATALQDYPEVNLFCGRIVPDWDGSEPAWVRDEGPYRICPSPIPRFDQGEEARRLPPGTATPGGGNLFLRTALLARVGPFAAELGPVGHNLGGSEDVEWVRRAQALNEPLLYVPAATQYHAVDATRLRLVYALRKAYERTASSVRAKGGNEPSDRLPRYLVRKILSHTVSAVFCLSGARRRHYLVRTAASLGELRGFLDRRRDRRLGIERV